MTPWQAWRGMAQGAERDTRVADVEGCLRSAASRYYYAAYQAATALILSGVNAADRTRGLEHR